jgi:thiamine-monophosphate kinase
MSDDTPNETNLIQSLFAPLTLGHPASFGLHDDVAFLPTAATAGFVITQDQVIEGTHFLASDPIDWAARRLVRRNVSDLIAKGAHPRAAFLSLAWPKARPRGEMADFAAGLGEDLKHVCGNCPLLGGDTSTTNGPLVASLTLLGEMAGTRTSPVLRSGAQVGDRVLVTGAIGDAWIALQIRLGHMSASDGLEACLKRATLPQHPPMALADLIAQYANASIDVSDGLLADATHLATQSGAALHLNLDHIPLSPEAQKWCDADPDQSLPRRLLLATGGDDYQPLLTLSPTHAQAFCAASQALGVPVTDLGSVAVGKGLHLRHHDHAVPLPARLGWGI